MANNFLYPAILDSSMPVFNQEGACNIYYSLSKFNSIEDIKSIQISILYQKSGVNAVKKISNSAINRYRDTGIIIVNEVPTAIPGKDNLYSITINPDDVNGGWLEEKYIKFNYVFLL